MITGTYPQSRFFSFVSYVAQGSVVDNGSLNDVDIKPDDGSTNPFVTSDSGAHNYTVTVGRTNTDGSTNFLPLGSTRLGWVIYRIYVPNKGLDRPAGAPVPTITVVGQDGKSHIVPECPSRSNAGAVANLVRDLAGQGINPVEALARILSGGTPGIPQQATCQPEPLVAWIPKNTGGYFPNPANKYIAIPGLCFHPNQILVVRGKAAKFPDTYDDQPIWEPPGTQMRYWSLCNNDQRIPYPVVACAADHQTNLDASNYYTYVISPPERHASPTGAPSWLPPDATWLPWGSKLGANILLFRNMLPQPGFTEAVQGAIEAGCVVDNQGTPPSRDAVVAGGACAHAVMRQYYPKAVYCDKQIFISEGWRGCFAVARETGRLSTEE